MSSSQEPKDAYLALRRFQTYFRDVVEPAVWTAAVPAAASVALLPDPKADPISAEMAASLTYLPVSTPWRWGPKWASAWFRVSASIPSHWAGLPVALRFSSGTEALIWHASTGAPPASPASAIQGLDVNRDAFLLTSSASGNEPISALIEAACNHPFGVTGFEWDPAEVHQRWNSSDPGLFDRCELAVFAPLAWELRQLYAFALQLLQEIPLDSNRAQQLILALQSATNAHHSPDQRDLARRDAAQAVAILSNALASTPPGSSTTCFAVGHAHLDTAWLWPIRETKRKVLRTFSNQLNNLDRFPDYVFLASQTQHYAYAKERDPVLFDRIKHHVANGRWEPAGGMWIEPDVNCVSGESLVRQILVGEHWWRNHFGDLAKQRFLYLPDTFGFGSNLPQIMRLAGLDTFITNKLHWWQHTTFPHTTFSWRGIDGSSVLAHNTPGRDYNATNTPKELLRGDQHHRNKSILPPLSASSSAAENSPLWLQPFGFGDGGGGATDWSIRFAQIASSCEGLPRVRFSSVSAFCDALHQQARDGAPFPEWAGELDMEIHRGTLTSQAPIKAANAAAEEALRLSETLAASLHSAPSSAFISDIDLAWKLTLLNQFHDILPGSSIAWVYEDAAKDHASIHSLLTPHSASNLQLLADRLQAPAVFNPTSRPFTGVIDLDGSPAFVSDIPALGAATFANTAQTPEPVSLSTSNAFSLSNSLAALSLDPALANLSSLGISPDLNLLTDFAGLFMYEDRPIMWDAWDIDHYYTEKPIPLGPVLSSKVLEKSALRSSIEFVRKLTNNSSATIRVVMHAASPRIDLHFAIDWHEQHSLLRFEIPTSLGLTARCTHATHFGHQSRPTHRNTAHERARFEFPAQGWLDLSEDLRGLALLSPAKFGFSCWQTPSGHRLGLSLLRSPTHPDPNADQGLHHFSISLLPHHGCWRSANLQHHAELLRSPLIPLPASSAHSSATRFQPFSIDPAIHSPITISAFKHALDNSSDLILRFHESQGRRSSCTLRWNFPVSNVRSVDLLERHSSNAIAKIDHHAQVTTVELTPFQIVTLRITR